MASCSTMTCHLCPGYHFKHVEFIAWITVIPSGANNLSKNWGMNQLQRAFKNKHGAYLVLQRTPYRCQTPLVSGQRTWFWVIWGLGWMCWPRKSRMHYLDFRWFLPSQEWTELPTLKSMHASRVELCRVLGCKTYKYGWTHVQLHLCHKEGVK